MLSKGNESISLSIMNVKHYILVWIMLSAFIYLPAQEKPSGYSIEVEIQGISDTSLILAHRYGDKFFTIDTLHLDSHGKGRFFGDELLLHGMYQVVMPDRSFLDFFIEDNQNFKIHTVAGQYINNHAIAVKTGAGLVDLDR